LLMKRGTLKSVGRNCFPDLRCAQESPFLVCAEGGDLEGNVRWKNYRQAVDTCPAHLNQALTWHCARAFCCAAVTSDEKKCLSKGNMTRLSEPLLRYCASGQTARVLLFSLRRWRKLMTKLFTSSSLATLWLRPGFFSNKPSWERKLLYTNAQMCHLLRDLSRTKSRPRECPNKSGIRTEFSAFPAV
jgi:hypothetical protein